MTYRGDGMKCDAQNSPSLQTTLTVPSATTTVSTPLSEKSDVYGIAFGAGDVVGCGWHKPTDTIFFTLNGKWLGAAFHLQHDGDATNLPEKEVSEKQKMIEPTLPLRPIVRLQGRGACVQANFGHEEFLFPLNDYLRSTLHWEDAASLVDLSHPDGDSPPPLVLKLPSDDMPTEKQGDLQRDTADGARPGHLTPLPWPGTVASPIPSPRRTMIQRITKGWPSWFLQEHSSHF